MPPLNFSCNLVGHTLNSESEALAVAIPPPENEALDPEIAARDQGARLENLG